MNNTFQLFLVVELYLYSWWRKGVMLFMHHHWNVSYIPNLSFKVFVQDLQMC